MIAAAAAGLLMLGGPAFAGGNDGMGDGHHNYGHAHGINNAANGQVGLVNLNDIDIIKNINLNAVVGACGNNVGVLGAAVPILSPSITGNCASGGIMSDNED
ncbi:hypothetical protein [Actinocrispum wychmicini]|uniref:hypothetical protein n=1 Tax=Actinocrispum wychmicini TaxID=1213861 RepID=UPI001FB5ABF7|nr:hypothetical protein [Actinocrispum wychmicini]